MRRPPAANQGRCALTCHSGPGIGHRAMATGLRVGVNTGAVTEHIEVLVVVVVVVVVLPLGSHIPMQRAEGASEAEEEVYH
jgi:hypothetical protein